MGSSNSKTDHFYTPIFCQMRNNYGGKCMVDIQELIKYHDFPEAGTLSKIRLNIVKESVKKNEGK